jgi:hypothetical protein
MWLRTARGYLDSSSEFTTFLSYGTIDSKQICNKSLIKILPWGCGVIFLLENLSTLPTTSRFSHHVEPQIPNKHAIFN